MDDQRLTRNPTARRHGPFPAWLDTIVDTSGVARARAVIAAWPGYAPTPLVALPGLAHALGVASFHVKNEGRRFCVGSFKALGPPYAFAQAVARVGRGAAAPIAVAATSGNHGRALAWGAARCAARCRIFMPAHTSAGRAEAIQTLGAEVIRVPGNFDAALEAACDEARHHPDRILVADLDDRDGDTTAIARDIIAGYAVLADELIEAPDFAHASHIFVAAGNGTLAAATVARLWQGLGFARPQVIAAEPRLSDCVRLSLAAGMPVTLADPGLSVMDGLVVGSPSRVAWPILRDGLDAAATVEDAEAIATLRALATGAYGDEPFEIGETGIAAIATAIAVARDDTNRAALGIDRKSAVVAIACEGVTDRTVFDKILRV
jgi:diaminopropionate ammonia-lyase